MKLSDVGILFSFSFILITIILSLNYMYIYKTEELKRTYSNMIELSLDGSLNSINEKLDDANINMLSDNNIELASINKELVFKKFLRLLSLNFKMDTSKTYYMSRYVPLFITIENDGIFTNIYDNGERKWSEKIPYVIKSDGTYYKFNLHDDMNLSKEEYELKKNAICRTIKRQFASCDIELNLPYDDTIFYNKVSNKGIIAVIKGIPIIGINTYDVIKMKGYDIKKKAKYIINEDNKYVKTYIENVTDEIVFDTKVEAAKHGYASVIY